MTVAEIKANSIVNLMVDIDGLQGISGDRPFLDFVLQLVRELAPLVIQCFMMANVEAELKNPKPLTRVRLRMFLRHKLRDDDVVDLFGRPLLNSILAVAKTTTADELKQIAGDA
jgi:hypothetical protein